MSKRSSNDDLFRDIYQENLYVAGRGEKRDRRIQQAFQRPPRNPTLILWLLGASGLLGYLTLVAFWTISADEPEQDAAVDAVAQVSKTKPAASTKEIVPESNTTVASAEPIGPPNIDDVIGKVVSSEPPRALVVPDATQLAGVQKLVDQGHSLAKLFGLSVRTIVIDPGHGGKDPGATGHLGTHEKDIALAIGKRLKERLAKNKAYKVLLTRETDSFMSLQERVNFANDNYADLFISIHINYFPRNKVNFIETYYFGPDADSDTAELAALENADSEFLYTDFKRMIRKIGDTMKFQESKELAAAVQDSLYAEMRKLNKRTSDHGIKPGPFVVLLGLDAPSILTEVTSLNDKKEERRLKSSEYRDKIAMFLEKGIVKYLNRENRPGGVGNGEEKENLAQAN